MVNLFLNKRILLGVTGSIAAYKAVEIASRLTKAGALVDVILTECATRFVAPLTFQSVTGRKAYTDADLWGGEGHVTHVGLGQAADLYVIAPISASTIARMANGLGDNLVSLTVLAARCPVVIAPAMDAGMYAHAATKANVEILKQRGVHVIGPVEGHLASGLVGPGRFVEPVDIISELAYLLSRSGPLAGKKILVTAGGTQEPIDPVRRITNRSSGRQGYALAQAALNAGADVTLISAPTNLIPPFGARVVPVVRVQEMLEAVLSEVMHTDALLMAAAASDFMPEEENADKIKKSARGMTLLLKSAPDILKAVAEIRQNTGQPGKVVGFAAESRDLEKYAAGKLREKNLDLIVANDILAADAGFEVDTNRVTLFYASGEKQTLPLMSKIEVAEKIIEIVQGWLVVTR